MSMPKTLSLSLAPSLPVLALALLLAACGSSPPVHLYQLRATPAAALAGSAPLLVMLPLQLPDYLDRDTLVARQGAGGLAALHGHRWAEPLADAAARVLRHNLAARLGADKVWAAPAPAGLRATWQLRVELQRFDADEGARELVLAARWALVDPNGANPPRVQQAEWREPVATPGPDALAAAHSAALHRLAQAIADAVVVR